MTKVLKLIKRSQPSILSNRSVSERQKIARNAEAARARLDSAKIENRSRFLAAAD